MNGYGYYWKRFQVETREIAKLKPNPRNPRGAVTHDVTLRELAMSIKSVGVLEPILITPHGIIIAGHRRVEAAKLVDLTSIPVIVRDIKPSEQVQMMLIENLQRSGLDVCQEAAAYVWLVEQGLTPSQISKAIGIEASRITNCIAIQSLPPDAQVYFRLGTIALSCASVLTALRTSEEKVFWANDAAKNKRDAATLRRAINAEGESIRQSPSLTETQMSKRAIRQLRMLDEKLDYFESFRPVQALLRQTVRLLQEKAQKPPGFKVFNRSTKSISP
jgi:ParB/RepB/Spo0J family partition protein